jgi:hypothetical protein
LGPWLDADRARMDLMVMGGFALAVAVALASLVLLRRSRSRAPEPAQPKPSGIPDPPIVEAESPVFITTNRGSRYHLGCLTGNGEIRYAIWTARSHELVRLFESTETGWRAAWDLFQRVERDRSAEWIDHRGARRSRREWMPAGQPRWPLRSDGS